MQSFVDVSVWVGLGFNSDLKSSRRYWQFLMNAEHIFANGSFAKGF